MPISKKGSCFLREENKIRISCVKTFNILCVVNLIILCKILWSLSQMESEININDNDDESLFDKGHGYLQ